MINNYEKADEVLQGRNKDSRKLENNTYLIRHKDCIAVRLHATDIVTYYPNNTSKLNTGGWQTVTTKDRMNKYSKASILQRSSLWYIEDENGDMLPFTNNMIINDKGGPKGKISFKEQIKKKILIEKINKYCKAITKLDKLPIPSTGDCIYCQFHDSETGLPLNNTEHLISHLDETYIMVSLIFNALTWKGYNDPSFIFNCGSRDTIVRAVRAYFKRQLGIS